jgi:hypothetical protein
MSRYEIKKPEVNVTVAYGIDHATGPFLQVWDHPEEEQDGAWFSWSDAGVDTFMQAEPRLTTTMLRARGTSRSHPGPFDVVEVCKELKVPLTKEDRLKIYQDMD